MRNFKIVAAGVAADTDGLGNEVTGATFTLTANSAGDSLAHKITVKNNTATDHAAKTIALVGTDADGNAQTETLTGPGTSATVTSTKYFKTLTSATPSATIGADTFDIGWAADAVSPWVYVNESKRSSQCAIGFGCEVTSGSPTYSVEHQFGGAAFTHGSVSAETTAQFGDYAYPINAMRLLLTAAGTVTLRAVMQDTP